MTSRCAPLRIAPPIPSQRATPAPEERNTARNDSATPDLKALALQVMARNRLRNASATTSLEARNTRATTSTTTEASSEGKSSVALSAGMETQRATISATAWAVAEEIGRHPRGIGDLKLKQVFWQRRVQSDALERAVAELLGKGVIARLAADPWAFALTPNQSGDMSAPVLRGPLRAEVEHG